MRIVRYLDQRGETHFGFQKTDGAVERLDGDVYSGPTPSGENTNDMIFDVPALIEFLSGSTTLLPGTVILTGTPHGVGMAAKPPQGLKPGDAITIEIVKNRFIDESRGIGKRTKTGIGIMTVD